MVFVSREAREKSSVLSVVFVLNPAQSSACEGGRGAHSSRFQRTSRERSASHVASCPLGVDRDGTFSSRRRR
jgi:hypothetical protein